MAIKNTYTCSRDLSIKLFDEIVSFFGVNFDKKCFKSHKKSKTGGHYFCYEIPKSLNIDEGIIMEIWYDSYATFDVKDKRIYYGFNFTSETLLTNFKNDYYPRPPLIEDVNTVPIPGNKGKEIWIKNGYKKHKLRFNVDFMEIYKNDEGYYYGGYFKEKNCLDKKTFDENKFAEIKEHIVDRFFLKVLESEKLPKRKNKSRNNFDFTDDPIHQQKSNNATSTKLRPGKIPRSQPKIYDGKEKWYAKPGRAKNALENNNFKCEFNPDHTTFISKSSTKQYMEGHHLVPMSKQNSVDADIDVPENILCLCPTCHRKIHLAKNNDRKRHLSEAFNNRRSGLQERGIDLTEKKLFRMYSIK